MKVLTIVALFIVSAMLVLGVSSSGNEASAQEGKKLPEVLTLAPESKLGSVKFSHTDHVTKNRSVDGTKPIACVECHHTAQPASEAVKHPAQDCVAGRSHDNTHCRSLREGSQCAASDSVPRLPCSSGREAEVVTRGSADQAGKQR